MDNATALSGGDSSTRGSKQIASFSSAHRKQLPAYSSITVCLLERRGQGGEVSTNTEESNFIDVDNAGRYCSSVSSLV